MKKFEYKTVGHTPDSNELEELGKEGWELCAIESHQETRPGYGEILIVRSELWVFKREISNIDYAGLLISCSYMRNVGQLQHRTILEFAQFVEDVMANKPEFKKYEFDINEKDAIRTWIEKFHAYCKEYYSNIERELHENEMETLRKIQEDNDKKL